MAVFRDWMPDVRSLVNAPNDIIVRFLREGMQQFIRDTLVWEHELGSLDMPAPDSVDADLFLPVPSEGADGFQIPAGARIWQMARVDIGERYRLQEEGFDFNPATGVFTVPNCLVQQGRTIRLWAVLEPVDEAAAATTIPAPLERWRSGVTNYAAAKLAAMPEQTWSRPEAASFFMGEYTVQKSEGVSYVRRGGVTHSVARRPVRVRGFTW